MEATITALGAEPDVEVVLDDSWSTDRITPEGPREAARRRLRPAAAARGGRARARPAPERHPPLPVLRLTETRLDNIFGPTPCRSLRYCTSCRQPFEQFKTI